VINTSKYAGINNPFRGVWGEGFPQERGGLGGLSPRDNRALGRLGRLGQLLRRWGDRWFAMNDMEAGWRGWQITKTHGGLGRRYRDLRFELLAACAQCAGAGVRADAACGPCLGTGRVTLGEAG
jgi:hypothetical protein